MSVEIQVRANGSPRGFSVPFTNYDVVAGDIFDRVFGGTERLYGRLVLSLSENRLKVVAITGHDREYWVEYLAQVLEELCGSNESRPSVPRQDIAAFIHV